MGLVDGESEEGCEAAEYWETSEMHTAPGESCRANCAEGIANTRGPTDSDREGNGHSGLWCYVECQHHYIYLCPAAVTWRDKAVMCGANHVQTSVTPRYATVSPYYQSNSHDQKCCVARQTASCATIATKPHWIYPLDDPWSTF